MRKPHFSSLGGLFVLGALLGGCDGAIPTSRGPKAPSAAADPDAVPNVDVAKARANGNTQLFEWTTFDKAAFDRAKRDNKMILIHGSASWCHWCHVMEAVTYRDPEIGRILKERFVTIKVDIDARPDVAERYGDYGWPATIILSADAKELGKLRGYQEPDRMREVLQGLEKPSPEADTAGAKTDTGDVASAPSELRFALASTMYAMDDYYDSDQGGWGRRQKAPIGPNLEVEAHRAERGDVVAKGRALQTMNAQRALLDPVWGGFYQYSAAEDWNAPHFEKLMAYQAENLEAYAVLVRATKDAAATKDGKAVAGFITTMFSDPKGGFYVSMDADVGGHDAKEKFVDGHVYYVQNDEGRRKLGIPRIDKNIYAADSGRAIAALAVFATVTRDDAMLERAKKGGDALAATHVGKRGEVVHDAEAPGTVRYLIDAACLGRAYVALFESTNDPKYKERAIAIADTMLVDFADPSADGGARGLYGMTKDDHAIGVFATRNRPFEGNTQAARFLGALSRVTKETKYQDRGRAVLAAITTPREITGQGRMLGHWLLAAQDLGLFDTIVK